MHTTDRGHAHYIHKVYIHVLLSCSIPPPSILVGSSCFHERIRHPCVTVPHAANTFCSVWLAGVCIYSKIAPVSCIADTHLLYVYIYIT